MKNKFTLFSIGLLLGFTAYARLTDNQIIFKTEGQFLKIEPKKGFHLNAEAPANATFDALEAIYKPIQKTERLFVFKLVDKTKKAKLSFYVCDDKKTVCEQHHDEVNLATLKTEAAIPPATRGSFVVTDTAQAPDQIATEQLLLSKNGKPTLLIFSAPWCPACIRMQTETYPAAAVSTQLKKVNFVKLNSDLPENYDLSEKFHVKAIPTLILLNPQGKEIYRWLDYQAAGAFAKSLNQEIKKIDFSKDSLEKKASLGDAEAISKVGLLYYNSLDCNQAAKWLSLSKRVEDKKFKLAADVSCAQEESEKDDKAMQEYLATLEKAIVLSPSSMDQTRWMVDWIEKKKELKQFSAEVQKKAESLLEKFGKQIKNSKQLAQDFQKSTYGDAVGFELAEAYLMRSRLFAVLENKAEKEKSDQQIINFIKDKKFNVNKPGEMLIGVAYLRETKEKIKVDQMYNQLIARYPKTYVYYEKYSRYLLKEKALDKSLANADQAITYAEGNQPQLFLLKARILKELNQNEKVIEIVNAAIQLKDIQHVRFKKTLVQLNKLKEEVVTK